MRTRKKRKTSASGFLTITAAALALPVVVNFCIGHMGALSQFGERAAMISAAIQMPDTALPILQERFRGEIYGDESLPETRTREGQPIWEVPTVPGEREGQTGESPAEQPSTTITPPKIPARYTGPLVAENFAGYDDGKLLPYGMGYIRNETAHSDEDVAAILETPFDIPFENNAEPQVLIVHTHATESFERYDSDTYDTRNTWRSTDNNQNMVAVGSALEQVLEKNGIGVIHDTTQHDYPSYNGSYERSAETIQAYLEEYPSIKVVLDLHRDAMQRDEDAIVKPVAVIDGRKAAQIMIISACDDGTMDVPMWRENFRFAAAFQDYMEQYYPDLTRPVYLCYRKYNMDLTTGSLLLEFGSNANTLEEAIYSAQMCGEALSQLINDYTEE